MRKLLTLLMSLLLLLLPVAALGEFNNAELERTENCIIMMQPGSRDMLVCPMNQPFAGELADGWLNVSVDFIEKMDVDMTLIRVAVGIEVYDNVYADTITFTVGGKCYAFAVEAEVFEYDAVFQEDYYICLTDESLAFLKALAQQKKDDPIPMAFLSGGETVMTGSVVIPGAEAAWIYDLFIDLGGKSQDLKGIVDRWPCVITKEK